MQQQVAPVAGSPSCARRADRRIMAALNRPVTANYVLHERVSVDTQGVCMCSLAFCYVVVEELLRDDIQDFFLT